MPLRWGMRLTSHEKRREGRNLHAATMKRSRTERSLRNMGIVSAEAGVSTLLLSKQQRIDLIVRDFLFHRSIAFG